MRITDHLLVTLYRRPYIELDWCERALRHPQHVAIQPNGRRRHWIYVEELGKYLREVIEIDGETIVTAFPDSSFKPARQ